ncbi:MAG: hypothetical protein ACAH80_11710 [Alphaproteobacteria bacterium]
MTPPKEPTLEEIHAQLKALTGAVEKLIEAQKPAAAPPEPAKKTGDLQDVRLVAVQPTAENHSYTFTIPTGSARNAFNNATPVEAVALPNYLVEKPDAKDLVDIPTTLAALAMETVRDNNRKALYPVALEDYLATVTREPGEQEALNIVEGKSWIGFGIVALKAQGADGKASNLYVVDDQLRQQIIVMGAESIPVGLNKKLAESGVTYVVRGRPETTEEINEFLSQGARVRGESGLLMTGRAVTDVIESLIKAVSAICELKEHDDDAVPLGTTLGRVMNGGMADKPGVFTSIMKASARPAGVK